MIVPFIPIAALPANSYIKNGGNTLDGGYIFKITNVSSRLSKIDFYDRPTGAAAFSYTEKESGKWNFISRFIGWDAHAVITFYFDTKPLIYIDRAAGLIYMINIVGGNTGPQPAYTSEIYGRVFTTSGSEVARYKLNSLDPSKNYNFYYCGISKIGDEISFEWFNEEPFSVGLNSWVSKIKHCKNGSLVDYIDTGLINIYPYAEGRGGASAFCSSYMGNTFVCVFGDTGPNHVTKIYNEGAWYGGSDVINDPTGEWITAINVTGDDRYLKNGVVAKNYNTLLYFDSNGVNRNYVGGQFTDNMVFGAFGKMAVTAKIPSGNFMFNGRVRNFSGAGNFGAVWHLGSTFGLAVYDLVNATAGDTSPVILMVPGIDLSSRHHVRNYNRLVA